MIKYEIDYSIEKRFGKLNLMIKWNSSTKKLLYDFILEHSRERSHILFGSIKGNEFSTALSELDSITRTEFGSSIESFNEDKRIIKAEHPIGYNAVLVYGYEKTLGIKQDSVMIFIYVASTYNKIIVYEEDISNESTGALIEKLKKKLDETFSIKWEL